MKHFGLGKHNTNLGPDTIATNTNVNQSERLRKFCQNKLPKLYNL